jgi:hypothetical protein
MPCEVPPKTKVPATNPTKGTYDDKRRRASSAGDQKAGDTNGQGVTAFGGGWFALTPAGDQITGQGSSAGGGSGY